MKALVLEAFGGPEKLQIKEVPRPIPKDDEVLIRVSYAGLNPVDWKIREGYLKDRLPHVFPLILGWDVSGVVVETGKRATGVKVGDQVYAYARKSTVQWGTYAEYVAVEAANVDLKPHSLSFAQAAAVPLSGLTAWQALFDEAKLKKGESVLILGGSGGVGSLAVQFAKAAGAKVAATASLSKHEYVRSLGADFLIDHSKDVVEQLKDWSKEGVDVVFDCFGKEAFTSGIKALKKGGRIVSILEHLDAAEANKLGISASYLFVKPNGKELKEIRQLIDNKKVTSQPVEEMDLKDAGDAQEKLRAGTINGKIVFRVY